MVKDNQLVLFKTPEKSGQEIKDALESHLPNYMVPQRYFTIDSFPLNKNRKLDIPQLIVGSKLDELQSGSQTEEECTQDVLFLEKRIALVWSKGLGITISMIEPSSNFFKLGGTSLSAVLVSRSLSAELGREVPVQDIFTHQTLRALGKFLASSFDSIRPDDPRPLFFLPGGTTMLNSFLYDLFQAVGLILMSLVVFLPVLGTIFAASRSLSLFGVNIVGISFITAILAIGCVTHLVIVLLCKKLLIGTYREGKAKVFSVYFLRWWLMRRIMRSTRLYSWAIDDTLLSCYFLRLFGAKIGKQVSIENVYMLEPDLVHVGDYSVVEYEVNFNTAQFRNGVLELRSVSGGRFI
jgi:hypothetical protein